MKGMKERIIGKASGFIGKWQMKGNNISMREDIRPINLCNIRIDGFIYLKVFIKSEEVNLKGLKFSGKGATCMSEAYDGYGFALEFNATVCFAMPDVIANFGISAGNVVEKGQQHGKDMFGNGIAVSFRSVDAQDVSFLSSDEINVFHACTGTGNEAEIGCCAEQFLVDGYAGTYNDGFEGRDDTEDFSFRKGGTIGDMNINLLHPFKKMRMNGINQKKVHYQILVIEGFRLLRMMK